MNILFISQLLPTPKSEGQISKALLDFLEVWKESNNLKVIRPSFAYEGLDFPDTKTYTINDIEVNIVKPLRIPLLKWTYYPINKIIKNLPFCPDVVVCHLYNSYFSMGRIAKKMNVPLVVGIHMSDMLISNKWFYKKMQQRVFANVSGFSCRSYAIENQFKDRFPEYKERSFTSISGLPSSFIENIGGIENRLERTKGPIKIITVASLIKLKHIDRVIQALAKTKLTNWTYTIIGSGPEYKALKQLVSEGHLEDRVRFLGFLDRKEVFNQLKQHDVFVLPSYPETLGLVYLEAMAAGNLVVCAKGWGVDGIIIDGENGFSCDAKSVKSIQIVLEKILEMSIEEKRKILKKSVQSIASHSIEDMAEFYLSKLREIIANYEGKVSQ